MNILTQLTNLRIGIGEVLRFETSVNSFAEEYTMTVYYRGLNGKSLVAQFNYDSFEELDRNSKLLYNSSHNHIINQRSKNES